MSVTVLKEELKEGVVRNLYLFYGPEEYLKKLYLKNIEEKVLTDGLKTVNKTVVEGKVDMERLTDICETLPMMSEKRLVVVKDSGLFKPKKKSGQEKGRTSGGGKDGLSKLVDGIPEHTCLIFYEAEIDGRLKIVDQIRKKGLVVEFSPQKPRDLVTWVVKTFKTLGKVVEPEAAAYMVDAGDLDMSSIMGEIDKTASYAGDREKITLSDVKEICSRSLRSRIFDLTDAIADRNGLLALKILNELITMKEPVPRILYMIARQFRQILEMKYIKESGAAPGQTASRLGVTPYAASKISKHAEKFEKSDLKKAIETCLELDRDIKTGRIEDRAAAEILIAIFSKA